MKNRFIYIMIIIVFILFTSACGKKVEGKSENSNFENSVKANVEENQLFEPFEIVIKGRSLDRIKTPEDDVKGNELWLSYSDGREKLILTSKEGDDKSILLGTIVNAFPSIDFKKIYFTGVSGSDFNNSVYEYNLENKLLKKLSDGWLYGILPSDDRLLINRVNEYWNTETFIVDLAGNTVGKYEVDGDFEKELDNIDLSSYVDYLSVDINKLYQDIGKAYEANNFGEVPPFITIDNNFYKLTFYSSFENERIKEVRLDVSYEEKAYPNVSILGINLGDDLNTTINRLGQGRIVEKYAEETKYEEIQYFHKGYVVSFLDSEFYGREAGKIACIKIYLNDYEEKYVDEIESVELSDNEILGVAYDLYYSLELFNNSIEGLDDKEEQFASWLLGYYGSSIVYERYVRNNEISNYFSDFQYGEPFEKRYVEKFVELVFDKEIVCERDYFDTIYGDPPITDGKILDVDKSDGFYISEIAFYEANYKLGTMKLKLMKEKGIIKILSIQYDKVNK